MQVYTSVTAMFISQNKKRKRNWYIHGLVQDYSNSIANALELLQSCAKPSIYPSKLKTQKVITASPANFQLHYVNISTDMESNRTSFPSKLKS